MAFAPVDYLIVCTYLVGVVYFGLRSGKHQSSATDYFLGGKEMAWWAVGFSIVASETSTLTFISIPGLAYKSDMHFLQLAFGYFIGRLLVSVVFIPAYYKGNLETAYDFLGKRFGQSLRKFTSSVFIATRVLASGVRLFATAIPIHIITGLDYPASIAIIGIFTMIYTYIGGLKAVVAMDVVQLFIYLGGAATAMVIILNGLPNGWGDVVRFATQNGTNKFEIVNPNWGKSIGEFFSSPYTLVGGLLGGTFLTMASHGTDQLLVQRLLGCRTAWDSQRALMLDAGFIVIQFAFFLILGLCLFAFYNGVPFAQLGLKSSDEIFPKFIVEQLPRGVAGLVIASVLASAMGTLSSAISSLASSTYLDLFKLTSKGKSLDHAQEMKWSKNFTLIWGVVLIGGAMIFTDTKNPVVEIGLKIASVTYGGLLGTFFLGLLFPRVTQREAYAGFMAGLLAMVAVLLWTSIDYTWHTVIGCVATLTFGNLAALVRTKT
ncbi:MAG TPA: sodium:solute symporter [Bacteroidota bacterium]|jgi:SSS family transporter|nr:sodium:solute symporter [Bacteroidota bacterium]